MSGHLKWSVKQSLLSYVNSLSDGKVTVKEPVFAQSETYFFPITGQEQFDWETFTGVLSCSGTIFFTGYAGMLSVEIRNPLLELDQGKGTLSTEFGGSIGPATKFALAHVEHTSENNFSAVLLETGRAILGPQYQAGDELDLLTIEKNHAGEHLSN